MNSHANAAAALMLDGNKIYYLRYVCGVLMRARGHQRVVKRRALAHTLTASLIPGAVRAVWSRFTTSIKRRINSQPRFIDSERARASPFSTRQQMNANCLFTAAASPN
jgi:hypothetical protein